MAKKIKDLEGAKAAQGEAKTALKEAKGALTTFLKENDLARDEDHSKHKKHGKTYKELSLAVDKAAAELDDATNIVGQFDTKGGKSEGKADKGGKGKKEKGGGGSAGRAQKYDYPPGLDAEGKKAFRVAARKEASGKGGEGKKGKGKAEKTSEAKGGKKEKATEVTKKDKGGKKDKSDKKGKKEKKSKKND